MESTYNYVPVNSVGAGSSATVSIIGFDLLQPSIQHCSTPVNEGDNVTLNCKGNGNPSPRTAWIKSGKVPSDRQ